MTAKGELPVVCHEIRSNGGFLFRHPAVVDPNPPLAISQSSGCSASENNISWVKRDRHFGTDDERAKI